MATILAVDDEHAWLELCRAHLESLGHDVISVDDGAAAVELVKSDPPDLMILDLAMPVSGSWVLHSARRHCPSLPVVVYTAHGGRRNDPACMCADAFVVKTTDFFDLLCTVRSLLRARAL